MSTARNTSRAERELLPAVGTARILMVRPVIAGSRNVKVTEQVDTVNPRGLTMRNVTEHGGHDMGTVGTIVTGIDAVVSLIVNLPLFK